MKTKTKQLLEQHIWIMKKWNEKEKNSAEKKKKNSFEIFTDITHWPGSGAPGLDIINSSRFNF